jgi:predicted RNA methylase
MLFTAKSLDDIEDRTIVDLGCGCGILSIAATICGAWYACIIHTATKSLILPSSSYVLGIDVDANALVTARENLAEADLENEMDFIMADVAELNNESTLLDRLKSEAAAERLYLYLMLIPVERMSSCQIRYGHHESSFRYQDQRN